MKAAILAILLAFSLPAYALDVKEAEKQAKTLQIRELPDGSLVMPRSEIEKIVAMLNAADAAVKELAKQRDAAQKAADRANRICGSKWI